MTYRALVVDKQGDAFSVAVRELSEADLPPGDVTIRVHWSSINYKDGLALSPTGRVIRTYPMVPGVDLAGVVLESSDSRFAPGQEVVVTGYDVGVSHPGGFAELARVPGDWVMPLPPGLTQKEAMAIGTAGFTAALSLEALEHNGLRPENGTVIVTGATGGVGSTAVAMLAQAGYTVAASTGKASEHAYLRELGASEILSREEVSAESTRPLESERWAGAVDPVGGATTAYLIRTMKYGASIALSGLTGGNTFNTTVYPFILRNVNLLGIDSVYTPMDRRRRTWQRLATDLKPRGLLDSIAVETDLDGVPAVCADILQGKVRGRTLVRLA
ncbi:acrylyl-CoA reductase family protein [Tepidiforma bonchosmolovskayae]|uniref:Acryloyl-CoA reductase n=1 Tax=Tepidiforma bonchosmolovskayae TaxID=2601677 RepID=A0ABX6C2W7_9CHLR|nr:acryloyl-CoA reductase [Tepidiforma bonchosmolovskayae]QFG03620.1 acryloyl-CoA reductase [Tepidiforma bonchosmolovskayae]